jgi:pilus assembly protein Flp/PilA
MMLSRVSDFVAQWASDEEGASLVEYILLVALIAVVCILAITFLGTAAKNRFSASANALNSTP